MGFQFSKEKKWMKKAYGGFSTALAALFIILFQVYLNGYMDSFLILLSFVPAIIGVLQGIHYMNLHQKDYIYMEEDRISIYNGPFFPKKEIEFGDIDYCVVVSELIIFRLNDKKEKQINTDWLLDDDLLLFREELKKRTKKEKLFRANPKTNHTFNHSS